MDAALGAKSDLQFGPFVLDRVRRRLTRDATVVKLTPTQFALLLYLAENPDRVVEKDELLNAVWGTRVVEEGNLSQAVFQLRRALLAEGNDGMIVTAPGRGYRFAAEVTQEWGPAQAQSLQTPFLVADGNRADISPPAPGPAFGRRVGLLTVLAVAGVITAIAAFKTIGWWQVANRPRLSIVVLPFRNLSPDRDKDYLADAISDDLTTDLSRMPGSLVIARTTADTYRNGTMPVTRIGHELNVRYVLEGSVRPEGNTLHTNAQLVNAETGAHIWADRFDVPAGHLDEARMAIEGRIRGSLDVELTHAEGLRSLHERPSNPDALDLYFQAMSILHRSEERSSFTKAEVMLKKAVALQPDFADANAALAFALIWQDPITREDYEEAEHAIEAALAAQPDNVVALSARAEILQVSGKYAAAESDIKTALKLDPNSSAALWELGVIDYFEGKSAGTITSINACLIRDPKSPRLPFFEGLIGDAYIETGDFGRAIDYLQQSVASVGKFGADRLIHAELSLMSAYGLAGQTANAQSLYRSFRARHPQMTIWGLAATRNKSYPQSNRFGRFNNGLRIAGMPDFADEHEVLHASETVGTDSQSPDTETPLTLQGATTIDTQQLKAMQARLPDLLVLDAGRGVAVPVFATWAWSTQDASDSAQSGGSVLSQFLNVVNGAAHGRKSAPIVIMGDGPYDMGDGPYLSLPYTAVQRLVQGGYSQLYWYRGGEQSWAQAGLPARELRP
jgi:TolB-like protein/DNA-binding winged helix-turn-helix (wHTH) protein/cytochrome c-type biogenesis protein CcmH/NrfG